MPASAEAHAPAGAVAVTESANRPPSGAADAAGKPGKAEAAKNLELAAPVKVNVDLLDKLMNLVSELVLARNRLLPFVTDNSDLNFTSAVRTIDILTLELQERMMKTRMQPISQVWSKFPRLVRDLSTELGKKVELIQEGADTELDRTLLEAIRDPLVHIVRNSVDHGIESIIDRKQANKPETGKLLLRARHENGMVVIEVIDDGGGINFERVRAKAVEKNLYSESKAANLTDQELIDVIFLPGFSTKEAITNLSGRGVGMDVVKTNINTIGGTIEMESPRGGVGTTIRLKIALTLAIMPALFVRCENERFAIPQNSLLEMVRFDLAKDPTGLEDFYGTPVFRLRGRLHPLLMLNQHLGLSDRYPAIDSAINIAVVQSAGVRFGLVVDEVLNMQEVVVKPMGALFKGLLDFAGATILGNGRVALILDVDGIAGSSGLIANSQSQRSHDDHMLDRHVPTTADEETTMLLFDIRGLGSLAIPLEYINRFEVFNPERVQMNGKKLVVSYSEVIMPLVVVKDFLSGKKKQGLDLTSSISVIVHISNGQPIGLVVDQIHDIVQVPKKLFSLSPPQRGLVGAALMGEKVINVLDLDEIMMLRNLEDDEKDELYPDVIEQ
jgi:two-component system chemotaxis sensor kinase CheA